MVHIASNEGDDQHDVGQWLEPVSDAEYIDRLAHLDTLG